MAGKSLIAAPLWAERYHHKPDVSIGYTVIVKNTRILHYQGFAGYLPVGYYFQLQFSG
jgi:hypothetical protein